MCKNGALEFCSHFHIVWKVSVFLRLKAQVESGRFVIPSIRPVNPHSEVPGSIR